MITVSTSFAHSVYSYNGVLNFM